MQLTGKQKQQEMHNSVDNLEFKTAHIRNKFDTAQGDHRLNHISSSVFIWKLRLQSSNISRKIELPQAHLLFSDGTVRSEKPSHSEGDHATQ